MTAGIGVSEALPQPEPGLTVDDFLERARSLRERLRAEQAETERRSCYSPELHEVFLAQGFYRMLQPRKFGGYELSVSDFYRVMMEIARGCPSTGWALCLGSAHALTVGTLFELDVQAELFGEQGVFIAPARIVPSVQAVPVDGGWRLTGEWSYSSGAPYSTHAIGSALLPPGSDGMPRMGTAIVPRAQYTVVDDWGNLLGLRGSGSNTIRVTDAVVPPGYVIDVPLQDIPFERTHGYGIHGNPQYSGRVPSFFFGELATVAVGLTRAVLEEYRSALDSKRPMWAPMTLRRDDSLYRLWYGDATVMTDAAEAALLAVADGYTRLCRRSCEDGEPFTLAEDQRLMSLTLQAGRQLADAIDLLYRTGGSSWLADGTATQRYWRDFSQYRTHVGHTMREVGLTMYTELELAAGTAGGGETM